MKTGECLIDTKSKYMSTEETAKALGLKDYRSIANWLQGGNFPGSFKNADGEWQFDPEAVKYMKMSLDKIRESKDLKSGFDWDSDCETEPPTF